MDWFDFFYNELKKDSIRTLVKKVQHFYETSTCYPEHSNIVNAFKLTPLDKVKVVIVGQDPYHEEGQAQGIAFSVPENAKIPPSFNNIFKEYQSDLNYPYPSSGDLTRWARNGVLLINSVLTVEKGKANSHNIKEYEVLFNDLISFISKSKEHVVFILWGDKAYKAKEFIDENKHLIIHSPHPSPLSSYRGFFSSHPFSRANEYLKLKGEEEVDFRLTSQETLF